MSIIDSPAGIRLYQFAATLERIKLEGKGIRFKGPAVFTEFKRTWGYTGTRTQVILQAEADKLAGKSNDLAVIHSEKYRELWLEFRAEGSGQ